jgi:chorismate dehydratase
MILGRLGRMAYINTLPVDWGLVSSPLGQLVNSRRGAPTTLNRLLAEGLLDVSPVSSVAAAENADEWLVLDNLCIGCSGEVGSVILQSAVPVQELHGLDVGVTEASATAARLLRVLLDQYWQVEVEFVPQDYPAAARLLIGDLALKTAQQESAGYIYDLGQVWKEYTGLDFVFGLWCVRKDFVAEYPRETLILYHLLRTSHALGQMESQKVVAAAEHITSLPEATLETYFTKLIYELDGDLWAGLQHFLGLLGFKRDRLQTYGESKQWIAGLGGGRRRAENPARLRTTCG